MHPVHRLRVAAPIFIGVGLLLLWQGFGVVPWMVRAWHNDPYFSHGPLVMVWGLALAAWRWRHPGTLQGGSSSELPRHKREVWVRGGNFLFLGGAVLLVLAAQARISTLLAMGWMMAVIGWLAWGMGPNRFRRIAFPLLFTLLAIPWPWGVVQSLALPLQEWSATASRWLLDGFGLPVFQEGIILDSGRFRLVVEETCSGLRSLAALLTVAVWLLGSGWGDRRHRWGLLPLLLLLVLIGNTLRLIGAMLLGYFGHPDAAMVWVEEIAAPLLIVLETALLILWLRVPMGRSSAIAAGAAPAIPPLAQRSAWVPFVALGLLLLQAAWGPGEHNVKGVVPNWSTPTGWRSTDAPLIANAVGDMVRALGQGAEIKAHRAWSPPPNPGLVDTLIMVHWGVEGRDVDDPRYCYRSQGWRMLQQETRSVAPGRFGPGEVMEIVEEQQRSGLNRLDWYAYRVGAHWAVDYWPMRWAQILGGIAQRGGTVVLVHLSTPLPYRAVSGTELALGRARLKAMLATLPDLSGVTEDGGSSVAVEAGATTRPPP